MDAQKIGKRLRMLRTDRGQSMAYVARKLGISYSAMASYEHGERIPRDHLKMRLAEHYGVSVADIFFAE